MRIVQCQQGTDEWKAARAGKVTASRICDATAKVKSGEAAGRRNYRAQLVAETLTGVPQDKGFVSAEMQWGTENEPFARAAYEIRNDVMVDQVGLVLHPTIDRAAASPDGLVGDDGLLEIKCPGTATHIQYLLDKVVPADYQPQMLWQMVCTGRKWCDFVSYDPRLPEHLQVFVARFPFDDVRAKGIEAEVVKLLAEVDSVISRLPQPEVVCV